ncbi:MAG: prepilin-type N-terminal cleavage/methylation domain-containing protein [Rickettsiales bacterium]
MSTPSLLSRRQDAQGFSLVELAIVLVIIGLIISSVLVGQDIIRAAELRSITAQYNDVRTGYQTFATRYQNKIPGDISNSASFGLTPTNCDSSAIGLGNGDGLIQDADNSDGAKETFDGEVGCFWMHLSETHLIAGSFDGYESTTPSATVNNVIDENMPRVKARASGWGVYTALNRNFLVAGVTGAQADDAYDTTATFAPRDAADIDSKIDDGMPYTGSVRARDPGTSDPDTYVSDGSVTACHLEGADSADATSDDVYSLALDAPGCTLIFELPTI